MKPVIFKSPFRIFYLILFSLFLGMVLFYNRKAAAAASQVVTSYPVVFAVENQTMALYPNINTQLVDALETVNQLYADALIGRHFYFERVTTYDKDTVTSCPDSPGYYLPVEYCSHALTYIFAAVDAKTGNQQGHAAPPKASLQWFFRDSPDIFTYDAIKVLAHELGHIFGLPDFDKIRVSTATNLVNGQIYQPFEADIMSQAAVGVGFSGWDSEVISRNPTNLPISFNWALYQPTNNTLKIVDYLNQPIASAAVKVYRWDTSAGILDATAEYTGTTDSLGLMNLGSNILGSNAANAVTAFLILVEKDSATDYQWLDFTDVNYAYWNGSTTDASYLIRTRLGMSETVPGSFPLVTGTDDVETGCLFVSNSLNLHFGTDTSCTPSQTYSTSWHFSIIPLDRAEHVEYAAMELTADGTYTNPLTLEVRAEKDNSYGLTVNPPPQAVKTTLSSVTWPVTESWTKGQKILTPNLASLVNEVVDTIGWYRGNDINIIVSLISGTDSRAVVALDQDPTNKARLIIQKKSVPGDLTGDGHVDLADLLQAISSLDIFTYNQVVTNLGK